MKKLAALCLVLLGCGCSVMQGPVCYVEPEDVMEKVSKAEKVAVVHFADGKANLSENDLKIIAKAAQKASETEANVIVYGHASHKTRTNDLIRRMLINLEISDLRAINVGRALAANGVPADKISAVAMFDSQPIKKEITKADEAANRRAEIYLYWF